MRRSVAKVSRLPLNNFYKHKMVFKITPALAQMALDAARRYKPIVCGTSDARKPETQVTTVWAPDDDSFADSEPTVTYTLVPHPQPYHPDDKTVLHTFRRFEPVWRASANGAAGAPPAVTGFKAVARAESASVVHKADLVALCGTNFHINEIKQMLRAVGEPLYPLPPFDILKAAQAAAQADATRRLARMGPTVRA